MPVGESEVEEGINQSDVGVAVEPDVPGVVNETMDMAGERRRRMGENVNRKS